MTSAILQSAIGLWLTPMQSAVNASGAGERKVEVSVNG